MTSHAAPLNNSNNQHNNNPDNNSLEETRKIRSNETSTSVAATEVTQSNSSSDDISFKDGLRKGIQYGINQKTNNFYKQQLMMSLQEQIRQALIAKGYGDMLA